METPEDLTHEVQVSLDRMQAQIKAKYLSQIEGLVSEVRTELGKVLRQARDELFMAVAQVAAIPAPSAAPSANDARVFRADLEKQASKVCAVVDNALEDTDMARHAALAKCLAEHAAKTEAAQILLATTMQTASQGWPTSQ